MEDLYRVLAEASHSTRCLEYDACPLNGGLIANIDGYSMSDSRLPWASASDWAWKALVAAASDVAASGGKPVASMYSIGVRSRQEAVEIARGIGEAANWLGLQVLKSDTNRCHCDAWIDVAVIGFSEAPIPRSRASPGEAVVQIGYAGYGAIAKLVLDGILDVENVGDVAEYTRRPKPPIVMGVVLPKCRVTASSDNSDGLAYTIATIAEASRVSIDLGDPLVDPSVAQLLRKMGVDVGMAVYGSWEDYNLVVTVDKAGAPCILEACSLNGVPCKVIGSVGEGRGVTYRGARIDVSGWSWL